MKKKPSFKPPEIVLASASLRRQEMLQALDIEFRTFIPDLKETWDPSLNAREVTRDLAERKARRYRNRDALVIGMDTLVVMNRLKLGKPGSAEDAVAMLRLLSGRTHQVVTGVALQWKGRVLSDSAVTQVEFRTLRSEEIEWYIQTGEPYDKAGAYAIQGAGRIFIKRIEGCYYNVVGFPLMLFQRLLRRFGLNILDLQRAKNLGSNR